MLDLNTMKTTELKQIGKKFQLKGWWNMKKEDLISSIEKVVSASDEALEFLNQYEKENAAIAEYTANWQKYGKRYNVTEFLEKWKAGKIVLESEQSVHKETMETAEKEEKSQKKEEVKPVEKKESKPKKQKEKEVNPFVYTNIEGVEFEDYDIGEKMMKWSEEKKVAFDKDFDEIFPTLDLDCLDSYVDSWSKEWDEAHGVKEEKKTTGHPAPKRGAQIEFNGKSQNICAWAEELGISPNTLYGRIYKLGWSVEKAFTKK